MSDNPTTPTATVRPIPSAKPEMHKCSRAECGWTFTVGMGKVPALVELYRIVRSTAVDSNYPLTRSEVLSQELCDKCARLATCGTFYTRATLALMERWAEKNAKAIAREQDAAYYVSMQRRREERGKHGSGDRSFINSIFKGTKPVVDKPHPKYRTRKHPTASGSVPGIKRYGDERRPANASEPSTKKGKKQKGGDQKQKKGRR